MKPDSAGIQQAIYLAQHIQTRHPDSALQLFRKTLEESRLADYEEGIVQSYFHTGYILFNRQEYRESLNNYYNAVLHAASSPRYHYRISEIFNNVGMVYIRMGDYAGGMKYLSAALRISDSLSAPLMDAGLYNNIAMTMRLTGIPGRPPDPQILRYLKLAEATARRQQNYGLLTSVLNNQGIFHGQNKDWVRSLAVLQESLHHSTAHHIPGSRIAALNNIANVYLEQKKPLEALFFLHQALEVPGAQTSAYRLHTLHTLGETYFHMGALDSAEAATLKALARVKATGFRRIAPELHELLSEIYKKQGEFEKALTHYTAFVTQRDSLLNEKVMHNVSQLELKYRTSQKDRELEQKEFRIVMQENQLQQKNMWILSTVTIAGILSVLLLALFRNNRNRQKLQAEQIRNMQQGQEIIRLKAVMKGEERERARIAAELHDGIVGQLAAVRLHFGAWRDQHHFQNDPSFAHALSGLDDAAKELRKTAHNLMPDILIQAGLTEAIRIHCDKLRQGKDTPEIHVYTSGSFPEPDPEFALSLYRIVQELIQNALKHAKARNIIIQLDYSEGLLGLTVEDDGTGMETGDSNDPGMGLKSIRSRISILRGSITISSAKGTGTTIYTEFDLSRQPEKNVKLYNHLSS